MPNYSVPLATRQLCYVLVRLLPHFEFSHNVRKFGLLMSSLLVSARVYGQYRARYILELEFASCTIALIDFVVADNLLLLRMYLGTGGETLD